MSRIGKKPIPVPSGVTVTVDANNVATVKGPKGTLTQAFDAGMTITQENNVITIARNSDAPKVRALHGLTRSLLANMVTGTSAGFEKILDINGVGYRAQKQGKKLILNLGYSHPVEVDEIDGITIDVPAQNIIIIKGADKQVVGQFAADVRNKRPPEPYKGKGIKYREEVIRRKEGKTGAKKK